MKTCHTIASSVLALAAFAGCGVGEAEEPPPHDDLTRADSAVTLSDSKTPDLVLHVSNQSFEDEVVELTIKIDGVTVVDGDFDVEDQHNWVTYRLDMPAGRHRLVATSDSGATLERTFRVPGDATRDAVLDHWTEKGTGTLTWQFSREPIVFG